ncbi:LEAF RUST 10 DISEASE-RESISTANCE LOCUS RECEPTOR-LIKE PROTEIN KINASE-like 2.5 [Syzygium oleosum]|uniref:LEAF RUST 10 DISEASE-RESISTANCE LOCUS RECEPTOR-LIKE PROTEIN KINASE-like 2.5 n=1 Tax=Syzygium oleosum TaxID=219896 RepID=UPI0024BB46E2|nr:LEAF RUST 10 DISEASE-RESISTANCE LOCUS RECEPTOR-LIKE PROTEIN KINASE-like 2.5 [Syzygium oleosum]
MIKSLSFTSMFRVLLLISHILLLLGMSCSAKKNHLCAASSCGEVRNISYPFRLKGDSKGCGLSKYELVCENNRTILYLYAGRYYVKSIYYSFYDGEDIFGGDITVVDDGLQKDNCSSLPRYTLARSNFSIYDPYYASFEHQTVSVAFMKCSQPVASTLYVDTEPCIEGAYSADAPPKFSQMKVYSYAGSDLQVWDIKDFCTITMMTYASDYIPGWEKDRYNPASLTYKDLRNMMAEGFNLSYGEVGLSTLSSIPSCFLFFRHRREWCRHYYDTCNNLCRILLLSTDKSRWHIALNVALKAAMDLSSVLGHFLAAKFILGAPCVLILLIYKWKRRHQAIDANIEEFLRAQNNFLPIRYSYSDIKKITKNFKYKLGEGGYGSVYRGILRSGNEVAVKILNKPKSNGQDFISEVATTGRIHHVNVVQLVGFCFDYSKQALVYDFMPNGSLDKHISFKGGDDPLDYKKMHEISLGIARGIEYLHRGCDMQILHFDIKPHNILLDRSFIPKISDFGLARLYPTGYSIVSLTAARGTLGYMAPELFYRDIGGVSYKADVYSFGMLLMEMAGRRRNLNAHAERSSQIYFPLWVYDQLSKEKEVEIVDVIEEERETTRKMIIVALWCIQLSPNDRPSMNKVLDMLEGDVDKLQLPPKPLLYPSRTPDDDVDAEIELETISSSSSAPVISGNYQLHQDSEFTKSCIV